jgi:small GTP-binding protein
MKMLPKKIEKLSDDQIIEIIQNEGGSIPANFLQYEKRNCILSQEDVLELIEQARIGSWAVLDLSQCGLTKIPETIGSLTNLKVLHLGNHGEIDLDEKNNNQIDELPDSIVNLKNLRLLSLYELKTKKLPKHFSKLISLRYVNLNGCSFVDFPMQLLDLPNLDVLCIGVENNPMCLPNEISKLSNLKELYMPQALIDSIPESVGELSNLKTLYLGRTQIKAIPASLNNLKNLETFNIENTPLSAKIPPEIFKQSPMEVIEYIIRFQSDANKKNLNESKMIIVGQGGVGKTCLLNRIVEDKYVENPSTEGIDISKWYFKKNYDYMLNIWDFGGQEIYHATHQFFLTKRSLYIFVWDSRQEDEYGRIDYWLNTLQSFADDSPIIIAINKCDASRKNNKSLDIDSLKRRYAQIVDAFYVSCQDGIKIDDLREEIIQAAVNLPLMNTIWFSSWLCVRTLLETMSKTKNIITYSEYLYVCEENSIKENEALSLIKYLHDLGVVLYFYDDNLLKNVVILSPNWGTNAVYRVLDAQANVLKERNGILLYSDLPKIWIDNKEYPEKTYQYILRLMTKFELSFVIKEYEAYLIAELLENKVRNTNLSFNNKDTSLNFNYYYDFLPAGVMTRFIVNSHEFLIEEDGIKQCWLKGAYLRYQEAYAKVQLFDGITERYIKIDVNGGNRKERSQLLQIIRTCFDSIHKSIPKIKFTEKILCDCSEECNYLHDYLYLLRLEQAGILVERCKHSLIDVEVLKLIEGIQFLKKQKENYMSNINIEVNPVITTTASARSESFNENNISIQITNKMNELQGLLNEVKDKIVECLPDYKEEYENMQKAVRELGNLKTKEEVVKSGSLNKVKRFVDECNNTGTALGKTVKGIKQGYSILQEIAEKYNSIAEWCGLPVVPKLFLK